VQWYLSPIEPNASFRVRLEIRQTPKGWVFRWVQNHKKALGEDLEVRMEDEAIIDPKRLAQTIPRLLAPRDGCSEWPFVFKIRHQIISGEPEVVLDQFFPGMLGMESFGPFIEIEYHSLRQEPLPYDRVLADIGVRHSVIDVTNQSNCTNQMIAKRSYAKLFQIPFSEVFRKIRDGLKPF